MYFSGDIVTDYLTVGDIYDRGEYIGTTAGELGNCAFKAYNARNVSIGSIYSLRPHGVFDGYGFVNGSVGPIYWKNLNSDANGDDTWLQGAAFRIGLVDPSSDVTFDAVTLIAGQHDDSLVNLIRSASAKNRNIVLPLSLTQDITTSSGGLINMTGSDGWLITGDLNLSGAGNRVILRYEDVINTTVDLRHRGTFRGTRINPQGSGNVGNRIRFQGGVPFTNGEASFAGPAFTFTQPVEGISSNWTRVTSATGAAFTYQLPGAGWYLVCTEAKRSTTSRRVGMNYVYWSGSTGAVNVASATPEFTIGSELTAATVTCNSSGLVSLAVTAGSSGDIDAIVSAPRLGILA